MKRINRKKLIEVLEIARQGYSTLIIKAKNDNDRLTLISCRAQHIMLNKQIVELGGDSVEPPQFD